MLTARTAHPRSRGEHESGHSPRVRASGSSPLTRGARRTWCSCSPPARLIPAHAGSTLAAPRSYPRWGAHPRSRGEHGNVKLVAANFQGSSPLTRGAPPVTRFGANPAGLIPAHAGSTFLWLLLVVVCWAHPRSRGEHVTTSRHQQGYRGSSPLTRGAP